MLGRRLMIARKLLAKVPERKIEEEMKVGRDTIWRVRRWLNDELPGYEQAISKLEKELDVRYFSNRYGRNSLLQFLKRK